MELEVRQFRWHEQFHGIPLKATFSLSIEVLASYINKIKAYILNANSK